MPTKVAAAQLTVRAVVVRLRPDASMAGKNVHFDVVVFEKLQGVGIPAAEFKLLVLLQTGGIERYAAY